MEHNHDTPHGIAHLATSAPGGAEQENDGYGNRGNRDIEFVVSVEDCPAALLAEGGSNDDDELDAEAHEEEEVEFEKSNEDLLRVSTTHRETWGLDRWRTWNVR